MLWKFGLSFCILFLAHAPAAEVKPALPESQAIDLKTLPVAPPDPPVFPSLANPDQRSPEVRLDEPVAPSAAPGGSLGPFLMVGIGFLAAVLCVAWYGWIARMR